MKRTMLTALWLGCAAIAFLTLPAKSDAQVGIRIGGGRGGFGNSYYGRPYGGYYGGGYGYGRYGPGYNNFGRSGVGISIGANPGYYGYNNYAQPGVVIGVPNVSQSFYPPQLVDAAPGAIDVASNDGRGRVVVNVPANAEVWWNGTRSTLSGDTRRYSTLPLSPEGEVQKFEARWTGPDGQPVAQARDVRAMPNTTVVVDFTRPESEEKTPASK